MIRILHIVPSLNKTSGITNVIMNYYKIIDREKYQFDFLYLFKFAENYSKEINTLGGKSYFLDNPKRILSFNKRIKEIIKENKNKYQIIHLHMPFLMFLFYPLKKKLKAKSFVVHSHSTKYGNSFFTNIRNKLLYRLTPFDADCYFACSKKAGNKIFGPKYKKKGFFMFNIINLKQEKNNINPIIDMPMIQNKTIIGHVGSFYLPKNHKYLIDIFCEYKKINESSVLMLIGEGYLKNKIIKYSKKLGIYDSILFLGRQNNINIYYKMMNIFVLPSKFEGFSLALLEAQANNLNCVVTDAIPKEAIYNKDKVFLISIKEKPSIWAKEINRITKNKNKVTKEINFDDVFLKYAKLLEDKYLKLAKDDE